MHAGNQNIAHVRSTKLGRAMRPAGEHRSYVEGQAIVPTIAIMDTYFHLKAEP